MSKIKFSLCILAYAFITMPFIFSCNNATNPQTYDSLTVVKPAVGDVVKAGTTITVQWGYPGNWPYKQTRVAATISNRSLPRYNELTPPINYPQNTFQWTVPSDTSGDSCRIKVYDYDENKDAYSGFFKITK